MNVLVQQSYKRFFKDESWKPFSGNLEEENHDEQSVEVCDPLERMVRGGHVLLGSNYLRSAAPDDSKFHVVYLPRPTTTPEPEQLKLPDVDTTEDLFRVLALEWREDTKLLSSISAIITHPSYLRIIGLGPAVLPFMLDDLAKTQSHWFVALRALTGENPVPPESAGRVKVMVSAWLDWGKARGFLHAPKIKNPNVQR